MHCHSQIDAARRAVAEHAAPGADRLRVAAREHVYHEGDDAEWLYEIVSGAVALYRNALDGSRIIEGVRFPGEIIGHARRGVHRTSALAVQPAALQRLARETLSVNPRLAAQIAGACGSELERLSDQIMILSSRSAVGSLAATLIDFADRGAGGGPVVTLPLRRAELADLLGLTVETASRAMGRLRALGAIELPRPDVVRIRDRALLHHLAEGDGEGSARGRCTGARCAA